YVLLMPRPPPTSTLFPYTTLFRSRGTIFTDRGVYKPGEEVHAKVVLRSDTPKGMQLLPPGTAVDIAVADSHSKEVDKRTVTLNRSEEHTSELQSLAYLVCRLLLEK